VIFVLCQQKERWFEQALKEKRGFIIKRMGEDGACLFRSVGKLYVTSIGSVCQACVITIIDV